MSDESVGGPVDRGVGRPFWDWWMLQSKVPFLNAEAVAFSAWSARDAEVEALRAALAELLDEADSGIATCPLTRKKARALLTPNAGAKAQPADTNG